MVTNLMAAADLTQGSITTKRGGVTMSPADASVQHGARLSAIPTCRSRQRKRRRTSTTWLYGDAKEQRAERLGTRGRTISQRRRRGSTTRRTHDATVGMTASLPMPPPTRARRGQGRRL